MLLGNKLYPIWSVCVCVCVEGGGGANDTTELAPVVQTLSSSVH